jgi:hypothetical protein
VSEMQLRPDDFVGWEELSEEVGWAAVHAFQTHLIGTNHEVPPRSGTWRVLFMHWQEDDAARRLSVGPGGYSMLEMLMREKGVRWEDFPDSEAYIQACFKDVDFKRLVSIQDLFGLREQVQERMNGAWR